jgi:hypothetical protein
MPTQENSEELPSEKETRKEKTSATLAKEALAVAKQNMTATPEPTQSEMTKTEALAVIWTGVEALAQMKAANLYLSHKTGRVVIELLAVEYSPKEGLVCVGSPLEVKNA